LALSVNVTFFEPDPKVKDMTSRPHSRLDLLYLACRTILTILTIVLETYGADRTAPFKKTTAYIPYYNFRYAVFRAALMMNFFWASLCFLFTVLRPYSDIGIIYIVLAPVSLLLAGFLVVARRRVIERIPVASITDPLTLELHIRFRLLDAGLLYRDATAPGSSPSDLEVGTNVRARGQGDFMSGISIGGARHVNGISSEKEMQLMDEISESFVIATKNMSKSCMLQLFAGAFHLIHLNNRAQCLATYTRAETLHPRMDEAFMIYRRQQLLNERFSGGDVIDFIAFEQNMQLAKKYENKATLAVIHFWSELLKKQPSFRKLQGYGTAISFAVSSAQSHYLALIKLSPDAPHVYRLYGNFLMHVLNDVKQGQDLLDHADELEEEHHKVRDEMEGDAQMETDKINLDILSEDNVIITLSGEPKNLGHIINVNAMAIKVFGYRRQELMNENVNKLLPTPFSESHDMFLKRYLETGFAKVIDRARQVLGLNKQGYLFPITLCVKHIVDTKGAQSFIGIIKPQTETETLGYLIMSPDLQVLHFTKNVGTLFNAKPISRGYDEIESRPMISEWIPSFSAESTTQLLSKVGMKTQYFSESDNYEVLLHGDKVEISGTSCYICRVKFKVLKVVDGKDSPKGEEAISEGNVQIPAACPFSERNLSANQGGRPTFAASADSSAGKDDVGSSGSIEMPMAFSAHASTDNVSHPTPSVQTIGLSAAPGKRFPKPENETEVAEATQKTATDSKYRVAKGKGTLMETSAKTVIAIVECIEYRKLYESADAALSGIFYQNEIAVKVVQVANSVRSLDLNRPYDVLKVVNACSTADREDAFRIGNKLPTEVLVYSAIGPILCLILILGIIQPLYMRIDDNKEKFLRMFYDIPKEVVKGIYESHLQRIMSNEEDDSDDADLANKFALEKVFGSIDVAEKGADVNQSRNSKRGATFAREDSKPINNPVSRWLAKANHDRHRVFLKTFVIFTITAIYFFVIGGLSYVYLGTIDDVANGVFWSSQREILVRKSTFFVREVFVDLIRNISLAQGIPTAQTSVPLDSTFVYKTAEMALDALEGLENSILYGNPSLGLSGVLSSGYSSPPVILEMQNGCVADSPADCATFDNGVMARGLHSASAWFQKRARLVLANITIASTSSNASIFLKNIDESVYVLKAMDESYLRIAYDAATNFYLANIRYVISWFSSFNLVRHVFYIIA
ncbi:hypothetical protein HDU67_004368, partial [Dinochytrium kinnereticum]